jgi:hypothetical protein
LTGSVVLLLLFIAGLLLLLRRGLLVFLALLRRTGRARWGAVALVLALLLLVSRLLPVAAFLILALLCRLPAIARAGLLGLLALVLCARLWLGLLRAVLRSFGSSLIAGCGTVSVLRWGGLYAWTLVALLRRTLWRLRNCDGSPKFGLLD